MKPLGLVQTREPVLIIRKMRQETDVLQFSQRFTHNMNVMNVAKHKICHGVGIRFLIAATSGLDNGKCKKLQTANINKSYRVTFTKLATALACGLAS